jgi:putative PEP-CTERM system histidine kinase
MNSFGLIGFSLAAFASFIFILLIFAARNNSLLAKWLILCAFISLITNTVAALQVKLGFNLQWVFIFEALKIAAWSVLILSCNVEEKTVKQMLNNSQIKGYLTTWLLLTLFAWLASYIVNYNYLFFLFIALNLWVLVLLEQLYRSSDSSIRWAILPLIIALAAMAIFDFVLFSQASMVGGLNFDFWYGRGFVAAFATPLLLISTRRIKDGSVRIFVSRHVVFYSSMLMIAGLYLLAMALAGYVINYIGGQWGSFISGLFFLLSIVVLLVLLVTESLRRKVKVFIAKNFFANKYEYRDEWLNLIEKIETTNAATYYQMATEIMMSKLAVDKGAIIKQISAHQFKIQYSQCLFADSQLNQQLFKISEFCAKNNWIVDIQEYAARPSDYPGLALDVEPFSHQKISIVVPIYIGQRFYGFFILAGETLPLNWEDRDLLFAVSKQLGNFVSLHEANDQLAESKQFDAFNRMSAFLVHDLKNVQAQLALITSNAEKHRDKPEFIDDVFETITSATSRLNKVLMQLRNKHVIEVSQKQVKVHELITKVVEQRNVDLPKVTIETNEKLSLLIDPDTFHSVLNHLLQNGQEATGNDGWVKIKASVRSNELHIVILDNGCGMSEDFIHNRLFKPFDTTKENAGMGIGVYEAKQFVESLGGIMRVTSVENEGSMFQLTLPLNN